MACHFTASFAAVSFFLKADHHGAEGIFTSGNCCDYHLFTCGCLEGLFSMVLTLD